MKKIVLFYIILIGLTTFTQSCKKSTDSNPVTLQIIETIKANEIYQFDLGYFGREEAASISIQAKHFSESSIDREINSGKVIYKYLPAINYAGTDEVSLKSARGSDGASPNNKIIITTIKFVVIN